jgi:hypothetical protein
MLGNAKYVIVNGCAIVFSPAINHSDMVKYGQTCTSAGFVQFTSSKDEWDETIIKATAYGKSVSLGIESKPEEDSMRITMQICGNY